RDKCHAQVLLVLNPFTRAPAQVGIECFGIEGAARSSYLPWHQPDFKRAGDRDGDFRLKRNDVLELTVEVLRPDVKSGHCVYQLRCNTHTGARPAHAAFEHCTDIESAADGRNINGRS